MKTLKLVKRKLTQKVFFEPHTLLLFICSPSLYLASLSCHIHMRGRTLALVTSTFPRSPVLFYPLYTCTILLKFHRHYRNYAFAFWLFLHCTLLQTQISLYFYWVRSSAVMIVEFHILLQVGISL